MEDRVFSSKKPQKPQKVPKNDPQKVPKNTLKTAIFCLSGAGGEKRASNDPKNTLKTAIFASLGRGEKNGPVMTLKTP